MLMVMPLVILCPTMGQNLKEILRKWFWMLRRSRPSSHPEGCFAVQKKTLQFFSMIFFRTKRRWEQEEHYRGPSYNIYSRAAMRFFLTPDKWCPKSFSLSKNDCERRSKQIYEIVKWRHFLSIFPKSFVIDSESHHRL